MIRREHFFKELKKINVFCFDLMQYSKKVDALNVSVFANFREQTYYSGDIFVDAQDFCDWNGTKWEIKRGLDVIKNQGIIQILDFLEVNYKDETDEER